MQRFEAHRVAKEPCLGHGDLGHERMQGRFVIAEVPGEFNVISCPHASTLGCAQALEGRPFAVGRIDAAVLDEQCSHGMAHAMDAPSRTMASAG